jgi:hypothetical protein
MSSKGQQEARDFSSECERYSQNIMISYEKSPMDTTSLDRS